MRHNRAPTEQEFKDWQDHPATKALHDLLLERRNDLKEQWASGAFTDQSQFGTAILNAKAIGNCEAVELILNLEYEQLLGESDGEQQRVETSGTSSPS